MENYLNNFQDMAVNSRSLNFLSFGEILWDFIEGSPYLGGAPFNVAAHLAQCGAQSYMLTRIGSDALGERALAEAKKLGVRTSLFQQDPRYPTGTVEVFLEGGQPDYTIHKNVAWDYIKAEKKQLKTFNFNGFYYGTLAQRNSISRKTLGWILDHMNFDTLFYDVNLRKDVLVPELIGPSLSFCDVFKLNHDEVEPISELLFGKKYSIADFSVAIQERFRVETVIITASEKGCYVSVGNKLNLIKGKKINLVDAVGAGDAFSAAFLWEYSQSKDAVQAAEIANQLGAFVASSRGAIPSYSPEIQKILTHQNY